MQETGVKRLNGCRKISTLDVPGVRIRLKTVMEQQRLTSERWRQVKQIFQAAVELAPTEREAYLANACAADPALRAEIASLLAAHEQPGSFLDAPAMEVATEPTSAPQDNLLVGKTLGHYHVLALLERGGMGEVYRAKDTTLGREVAVKVLPSAFSVDRDRLQRFEQEARAASALNLTGDSPAADTQPAFSHNGERIAFRSEREGGASI